MKKLLIFLSVLILLAGCGKATPGATLAPSADVTGATPTPVLSVTPSPTPPPPGATPDAGETVADHTQTPGTTQGGADGDPDTTPVPDQAGTPPPPGSTPQPGADPSAPPRPGVPNATPTRAPTPKPSTVPPTNPATQGSWQLMGPGSGGTLVNPFIHPNNPATWICGSDMSNTFVSRNGGASFSMFQFNGSATYGYDPRDAKVLYACGNGLFRSQDSGASWKLLFPREQDLASPPTQTYAEEGVIYNLKPGVSAPNDTIAAVVVDPVDGTIYCATLGASGAIYRSTNGGTTFAHWASLGLDPGFVKLAVDSADRSLVALTGGGLIRYNRANAARTHAYAATWRDADWCVAGMAMTYFAVETVNGDTQFAQRIKKSTNGTTFTTLPGFSQNLPGSGKRSFNLVAAANANVLYASIQGDADYRYGTIKSTDGGQTWGWVFQSQGQTPANLTNPGWMENRFSVGWCGDAWGMAVCKSNPNYVFVTNMGTAYGSTDGGATWQQKCSTAVATSKGTAYASTGLNMTACYFVEADPHDPKHLLAGNADIGGMTSFDGGKSWFVTSRGAGAPPREWSNSLYGAAFDPAVPGLCWGAWAGAHELPLTRVFKRDLSTYQGGVTVSTDGGLTWATSNNGLPSNATCTDITVDPTSSVGNRTLYVTVLNRGVYRSTDNGRNWSLFNAGITQSGPRAWRLTWAPDGALWLIVTTQGNDTRDMAPGALYRLAKGSTAWQSRALPNTGKAPLDVRAITSISFDPTNANVIYASGRAYNTNAIYGGGAYRSTDGGATWTTIYPANVNVLAVRADPVVPNRIFLCSYEGKVLQSNDRGATWITIPGFGFLMPFDICFNPAEPGTIYVPTFGGGIWKK